MLDPEKRKTYRELLHNVAIREREYYRLVDAKKAATIVYGLQMRPMIDDAYRKMQTARDELTKFQKENDTNE